LVPWRDIVTPHPDVSSGRYQQAEFAADLWQVYLNEGSDEYKHPTEFFRRTFITEGLRQLLGRALLRLAGKGGDPVVELQTNFGGGKTHSMLALWHLFSGAPAGELPGADDLIKDSGVDIARRVVLVSNKIAPGQPQKKPDGCVVRTLWGEIAWQLGRKEGHELIREADEGFEIVRRRLFQPLAGEKGCQRDAVARAFSEIYAGQQQEFPSECREADYERRIKMAYPIHPELFDRLYNDWSTLDKFQRTRGVLRLMAAVIHTLWHRDDRNLLIQNCRTLRFGSYGFEEA
jgi:predicted AAA+ superfamily ATPase